MNTSLLAKTLATLGLVALLASSCGNDAPADDGANHVTPTGGGDACATPNEGCPCDATGQVVSCGKISHVGPDGYVACEIGHRTCVGNRWGACAGEGDAKTKSIVLGGGLALQSGGLQPLTLGASATCPSSGPNANPCDPYCTQFIDDSSGLVLDGGVLATEGGVTIDPSAGGTDGGTVGGGFIATSGGTSQCSPTNRNIVGPACVAPGLTTCQQDFRCDPTTSQCLWNGGPGYRDASLGGIDLTVGVPCGPSGSAVSTAPVCNRGSVPVPAGSPIRFHQTNGASPPNGCTDLGPPTFSFTLGAALAPGDCTSFALANSVGAKFITLNAGAPGSQPIAEAAGRCANNSAYWKTDANDCALCNNACNTRLTGSIFDPRGANELPGVLVYVPSTTPAALPADGVPACDTCASLVSGSPFSQTLTAFDGSFTLDVPPGGSFPLVIQTGRWRRVVTVPAVPACTTATLGAALSHLPKNKTEGNIPKMALTMAQGDQLECLLRKIGLDDSEFTAAGGTGRVHLYSLNGMSFSGATNGQTNLWGDAASLNSYSAIIAPCDNNHTTYPSPTAPGPNTTHPPNPTATASQRANMKSYLDSGGRLFTTHWMSHDFVHLNWAAPAGPAAGEFGSNVDADRESPAFPYTIDTSTPTGDLFAQWGAFIGASSVGPPPTIAFSSWRHLSKTVNTAAGATRLTYGDSTQAPANHPQNSSQWGGPHVNMYQFETPWAGSPAGPQCGRVSVSQSHVQTGSGTFPGGCGSATTALTPQQKAFEFLLFESQACLGPPPPPPTPPAPPPLPSVTFTRDYEATCTPGFYPRWAPFYWQASIPAGTSMTFKAGTATTQAGLPATSTSAGVRAIGTATTTVTPPAWDCDGCPNSPVTVDYHLRNDPPPPNDQSRVWLRVFITFTPNNTALPPVAPTLTSWRQVYDCVPSE